MPRPEHSSLPNLYDEDYTEENIYDVVKAVVRHDVAKVTTKRSY